MTDGEDEREARLRKDFDEALRLRDAGELARARMALERLAREYPERPSVIGTLAGIQFAAGDYEQAATTGRLSVRLAPKSELASRTLFHAYMRLQDIEAAFSEVARFRTIKDSAEYERTLAEIEDGTLRSLQDHPHCALLNCVLERVRQELKARPLKQ
jgi:predicted Zn-dependent protease